MMDKSFIEKILELAVPTVVEEEGYRLTDKRLSVIALPGPETVVTHTLKGLLAILKAEYEDDCTRFVHVVSPSVIKVFGCLRADESRREFYTAEALLPSIKYGSFMPVEEMIIMLRTQFVDTENVRTLLTAIGNLRSFNSQKTSDDGVTQTIQVSEGIDMEGTLNIEPIRKLKPYRTFTEVAQPEGEFLFRMRQDPRSGVMAALFEADGGDWRVKAADILTAYLTEQLAELEGVTVIQ